MNATDKDRAMVEAAAKKAAARNEKALAAKRAAKATRKTAATKKGTQRKATKSAKKVTTTERFDVEGARLKKLVDGGMDIAAAAKKAGMSVGKAQRLYARITLKPGDVLTGTETEIAKAIVRLRDEEGLSFVPDIWARVEGMSGARIKKLYEAAKKPK
jgi:hypothetical protein